METTFNASQLRIVYNMSSSAYHDQLKLHRKKLNNMATFRKNGLGKAIKRQNYNVLQLKYIIEVIMKDTPYGYDYNGTTLIKNSDYGK
jgi:hypothetical protein